MQMSGWRTISTYSSIAESVKDKVEHEEDLRALLDDITEFVGSLKKSMEAM